MKPITRTHYLPSPGNPAMMAIACFVLDKRTDQYNRILIWYPNTRFLQFWDAGFRTAYTAAMLNQFCTDLLIPVRTQFHRKDGGSFTSTEYAPTRLFLTPMHRMVYNAQQAQSDPYDTLTINGEAVATMSWKDAVEWYLSPPPEYGIGEDD